MLYICAGQSGIAPQTLTRLGDTQWVLAPFFPKDGPFMTQNSDLTKAMWATAATGIVSVFASFNAFANTDVGRLIRLAVQNFDVPTWTTQVTYAAGNLVRFNGNTYVAITAGTAGVNPPVQIQGSAFDGAPGVLWLYQDSGYGICQITATVNATQVQAKVLVQLPAACIGFSIPITGITQANPAVISASATSPVQPGHMGFIYGVGGMSQLNNQLAVATATTGTTLTLGAIDSTSFTAYTTGGNFVDQATTLWSLGQWSNTTEWPRACAFFRGRLWMFGSLFLNGSVPALYTSFALDTAGVISANNSIQIILSFDEVNTIEWALALDRLIIGCDGGEFALYEQTPNQVLGPANVQIVRQSQHRCSTVEPQLVNTSLIYGQRAGRKILAMDYDFTIDKYRSIDMTAWAYHIGQSQFCDSTYAAEPWATLWYPRNDGVLVGLTFDREQNVYGWHRHIMGGNFQGGNAMVESVSACPAPDGARDELWMIVKRTIGTQTVRSVEYVSKGFEDGDPQSSVFYVDNGLTGTFMTNGVSPFTVGGLSYLIGETVSITVNGAAYPDQVVAFDGTISIELNAIPQSIVVSVGLPYPSVLITERPEAGADIGTSQGKTKRINWAAIRLYNSLGGSYGIDGLLDPETGEQLLDEIQYRSAGDPMDSPPPLFTGDYVVRGFPADYEGDCRIRIEQDQPLPMTILGIFPKVVGYEPT